MPGTRLSCGHQGNYKNTSGLFSLPTFTYKTLSYFWSEANEGIYNTKVLLAFISGYSSNTCSLHSKMFPKEFRLGR